MIKMKVEECEVIEQKPPVVPMVISTPVTAIMTGDNQPLLPNLTPISIDDAIRKLQDAPNQLVKRECLSYLADRIPIKDTSLPQFANGSDSHDSPAIVKILRDYSQHRDQRVRAAALAGLLHLHERGATVDVSLYSEFCEALFDDFEHCRISAIKLLTVTAQLYGDCLVCVGQGDEQIRLADDAFAKVCSMVNDISVMVRTQAASFMGKFTHVSAHFLDQTLDKKLMSNLKKKKTAHDRHREIYAAGEWSSGKKWADDAPQETVCPDSVNLMDIGACGAFIHGLEDELLEVRMATLESLGEMAKRYSNFANQSLDFLVDMFNDEIEEVRLKAIQCLCQISNNSSITLREDQIDIILSALEDNSIDIREALHELLGSCQMDGPGAVRSTVQSLITNLRRFPQDRDSIWYSLTNIGKSHAKIVASLVEDLLGIHPFLDLPEPSLENPAHLCILFLVFNAAALEPAMVEKFEKYTARHYSYLRDAHPNLVPVVKGMDKDEETRITKRSETNNLEADNTPTRNFLLSIFQRIRNTISSERISIQTEVIDISIRDLQRLREVEPALASACEFLVQYLSCQMSLRKILVNNNWINAFLLSALQSSVFRSSLQQILVTTFRLNHQFYGIHPMQFALIQQTRVKALALQLMAIIHGSNASALTLCDAFLEELQSLEKHLREQNIEPDRLTASMIREINSLDKPKPGSVARILQPLFLSQDNLTTQLADLSLMASEQSFPSLLKLRMANAVIHEPGRSDVALKFTAGLVLSVRMDAALYNIKDTRFVRIRIKYPDQQTHIILPKLSDFRLLAKQDDEDIQNYRLYTNVYLSHAAWTEPSPVEIGLILDFRETSSVALSVSQLWAAKAGSISGQQKNKSEHCLLVDLCRPVKVHLSPKPPKKGSI